KMVSNQQVDTIRLLTRGTGRTPNVQTAFGAAPVDQCWDHEFAQGLERMVVAKKGTLGGHHGVDDLPVYSVAGLAAQKGDQLADRLQSKLARERRQPGLDQILLARFQDNSAA